ncbi:LOW QUALITY PROTEIN: large ribosomal subunit protein P1-like [Molossus nigricans]
MASIWELTCIYSALILQDNEVPVKEDKVSTLMKAASVNVEPLWPGLFAKTPAIVNIGNLVFSEGADELAPAAGTAQQEVPRSSTAAPAEKTVEAKKEESEESDDDMGFGLFD